MSNAGRLPDFSSEHRLAEIRRKAAEGKPLESGIRPVGAPFPKASPADGYYGIHLLKEPQWSKEIPLYMFVGGAAGASAVIAGAAEWIGHDPELVRSARWLAAAGGFLSPVLLIKDLGVPSRFLNMLRVIKLQSPMNAGAWTLMAFSTFSAASAFANLLRRKLPQAAPVSVLENASGILAAATGLVMASYTGVLIGATVIPVWNHHASTLPAHFAASGLNCAVSILEVLGFENRRALNMLGISACAYESAQGVVVEAERSAVNDPLHRGASGWITRAGGVLSGPLPLALRLFSLVTGSKKMRRAAAYSSIAGSLLTRYGWLRAGTVSARDYRLPLKIEDEQKPSRRHVEGVLPQKFVA